MILLDLSQVMISNVMSQVGAHTDAIQPDLVRHMIINTIRSLKMKFGATYGELIIACDDRKYWRRSYFPAYKGSRKADREKSNIDWAALFDTLNTIKQEIKDNFPYRVLQVEGAEADDIIGSLCHACSMIGFKPDVNINTTSKILILSGDKDFVQLQIYPTVRQYDPVRKKDITSSDPEKFLQHLILAGDRGDGVPNVLSPDNCIIEGQRQKPLRETKITEIKQKSLSDNLASLVLSINYNIKVKKIDLTPEEKTEIMQKLDKLKQQMGFIQQSYITLKYQNLEAATSSYLTTYAQSGTREIKVKIITELDTLKSYINGSDGPLFISSEARSKIYDEIKEIIEASKLQSISNHFIAGLECAQSKVLGFSISEKDPNPESVLFDI